jgi:hypothetical protein
MQSFEPSLLNTWECVSEVGFVIVIIAVCGEVAEILVKWFTWKRWHKKSRRVRVLVFPPVRWMRKRLLLIETVVFVMLVFGLAVEFLGSHKAAQISRQENSELTTEAAQLGLKALILEKRVEELRSTNLHLQANVLELKGRVQPRKVSKEAHAKLIAKLRLKSKGPISVQAKVMDPEARELAAQILTALTESGFENRPRIAQMFSMGAPGVLLFVKTSPIRPFMLCSFNRLLPRLDSQLKVIMPVTEIGSQNSLMPQIRIWFLFGYRKSHKMIDNGSGTSELQSLPPAKGF